MAPKGVIPVLKHSQDPVVHHLENISDEFDCKLNHLLRLKNFVAYQVSIGEITCLHDSLEAMEGILHVCPIPIMIELCAILEKLDPTPAFMSTLYKTLKSLNLSYLDMRKILRSIITYSIKDVPLITSIISKLIIFYNIGCSRFYIDILKAYSLIVFTPDNLNVIGINNLIINTNDIPPKDLHYKIVYLVSLCRLNRVGYRFSEYILKSYKAVTYTNWKSLSPGDFILLFEAIHIYQNDRIFSKMLMFFYSYKFDFPQLLQLTCLIHTLPMKYRHRFLCRYLKFRSVTMNTINSLISEIYCYMHRYGFLYMFSLLLDRNCPITDLSSFHKDHIHRINTSFMSI